MWRPATWCLARHGFYGCKCLTGFSQFLIPSEAGASAASCLNAKNKYIRTSWLIHFLMGQSLFISIAGRAHVRYGPYRDRLSYPNIESNFHLASFIFIQERSSSFSSESVAARDTRPFVLCLDQHSCRFPETSAAPAVLLLHIQSRIHVAVRLVPRFE